MFWRSMNARIYNLTVNEIVLTCLAVNEIDNFLKNIGPKLINFKNILGYKKIIRSKMGQFKDTIHGKDIEVDGDFLSCKFS